MHSQAGWAHLVSSGIPYPLSSKSTPAPSARQRISSRAKRAGAFEERVYAGRILHRFHGGASGSPTVKPYTEAGFSIGLRIHDDGPIIDAVLGMPAFLAGVGPGMKLLEVAGHKWSPDALRAALLASTRVKAPLTLTLENDKVTKTVAIDYHDGLREPHLERPPSGTDVLHDIVARRVKTGG